MLKRYSIIAFLIFSYTIVLGHSIIPHHHHDEDHEMEHSLPHYDDHHHSDKDHPDDEDSGLAHDLGNYFHAGETGDFYQQSTNAKISYSTFATAYIIAAFDFKIEPYEGPPPVVRHSHEHLPPLQRYLSSKGLRAPPCA
jgi:hypothetical protein